MTATPLTPTPASVPPGTPVRALLVRRRLLATATVLAAATLLVGHALNVPATLATGPFLDQVAAGPGLFLLGGLLQAAAAFLLIPSAVGVLGLIRSRGAATATAGTVLTGVGAAATGAGLVMITTTMAMLVDTDHAVAARVFDVASTSTIGGLPFLLAPAMPVGLLLLAVALLRARTVPRLDAVVLAVGAVLAGLAPGGGWTGALGHLPLAVALVLLAVRLWPAGSPSGEEPHTAG